MSNQLTIGRIARLSGLPAKTIRFYEDEGLIPPPRRTPSGYRLYGESDLMRLRLVRRARLLGLDLPAIKSLLSKALAEDCAAFGDELLSLLAKQREQVDHRIAELMATRQELDALLAHVNHCCEGCTPDQLAGECCFCGLICEEKGGESE